MKVGDLVILNEEEIITHPAAWMHGFEERVGIIMYVDSCHDVRVYWGEDYPEELEYSSQLVVIGETNGAGRYCRST
jgi:hypothetical protein